jgi:hypothetical protein
LWRSYACAPNCSCYSDVYVRAGGDRGDGDEYPGCEGSGGHSDADTIPGHGPQPDTDRHAYAPADKYRHADPATDRYV